VTRERYENSFAEPAPRFTRPVPAVRTGFLGTVGGYRDQNRGD
jgi:hypothetical protein